uniref:Probable GPI-anchored adhesin-like protein PGA55-like n=1 Tax=Saccoglossus kowalevskii TaxID=10224 RepID=A0ABM0N062_SACKO|nr:PREDICTED: probable GPI-anchored adhesin-like protein PGA55-like [Saccoglossus kowalevskii]
MIVTLQYVVLLQLSMFNSQDNKSEPSLSAHLLESASEVVESNKQCCVESDTGKVIGASLPAKQEIGASLPAKQEIGASLPAKQEIGASLPAKQEIGASLPAKQEIGARLPAKQEIGAVEDLPPVAPKEESLTSPTNSEKEISVKSPLLGEFDPLCCESPSNELKETNTESTPIDTAESKTEDSAPTLNSESENIAPVDTVQLQEFLEPGVHELLIEPNDKIASDTVKVLPEKHQSEPESCIEDIDDPRSTEVNDLADLLQQLTVSVEQEVQEKEQIVSDVSEVTAPDILQGIARPTVESENTWLQAEPVKSEGQSDEIASPILTTLEENTKPEHIEEQELTVSEITSQPNLSQAVTQASEESDATAKSDLFEVKPEVTSEPEPSQIATQALEELNIAVKSDLSEVKPEVTSEPEPSQIATQASEELDIAAKSYLFEVKPKTTSELEASQTATRVSEESVVKPEVTSELEAPQTATQISEESEIIEKSDLSEVKPEVTSEQEASQTTTQVSEESEVTEKSDLSEVKPEVTSEQEASQTTTQFSEESEVTEKSDLSEVKPEVTSEQEASQTTTQVSEESEVTEKSDLSEVKPEVTSEQEASQTTTRVSKESEVTEKSDLSEVKPEVTSEQEASQTTTQVSEESEVTEKSDLSEVKPEVTSEQEASQTTTQVSEESEVTEKSDLSEVKPEVTSEQETSQTATQVSEESEVTEKSDLSEVKPEVTSQPDNSQVLEVAQPRPQETFDCVETSPGSIGEDKKVGTKPTNKLKKKSSPAKAKSEKTPKKRKPLPEKPWKKGKGKPKQTGGDFGFEIFAPSEKTSQPSESDQAIKVSASQKVDSSESIKPVGSIQEPVLNYFEELLDSKETKLKGNIGVNQQAPKPVPLDDIPISVPQPKDIYNMDPNEIDNPFVSSRKMQNSPLPNNGGYDFENTTELMREDDPKPIPPATNNNTSSKVHFSEEDSAPQEEFKPAAEAVSMTNPPDLFLDKDPVFQDFQFVTNNPDFLESEPSLGLDEDFSGEAFQPADPSAFDIDFLERAGSSSAFKESALARQSLYVKFDPLVKGASPPVLAKAAPETKQPLTTLGEDSMEGEDLLQMSTPPSNKSAQNHIINSVRKTESSSDDGVDRLLQFSPSGKQVTEADPSPPPPLPNLEESGEEMVQPLLYTQLDLKRAQDEFMREVQNVNKEKQSLECKLEEVKQENREMRTIVDEFEKTIQQMIEDSTKGKNVTKDNLDQTRKERDQALDDLSSVESAFSDLHRRYEKLKTAVEGYKKNEEILKNCVADGHARLKKSEQKYHTLKTHAEEKIER